VLRPAELRARGIRAVLFDKDGTLVDSLGPWAEAERALCETLAARRFAAPRSGSGPAAAVVGAMLADIGVRGGAGLFVRVDERGYPDG
jgi:phosphoglycolate phosphatase-like HAD superfamily hydrolase